MRQRSREAIKWRRQMRCWVGRFRGEGGEHTPWTRLGDGTREEAQQAYDRWFQTGEEPRAERGAETFETVAERLVASQVGEEKVLDRQTRLRRYAYPEIGMLPVAELGAHHVLGVLEKMAARGYSGSYVDKMRVDISQVLELVKSRGTVLVNVARSLALPKAVTVDTRPRMSLSDEQVVRFHEKHGYLKPLAMAALFSRQIAGHRTSDINAADWAHVDTRDFVNMRVRRPKTDGEVGMKTTADKARKTRAYEMVTHEIDESLRPLVRAYWLAQGSPKRGPVFPLQRDGVAGPVRRKDGKVALRRGGKAGERRGQGSSFAKALRRMVWEAGIYDPDPAQDWDPDRPDPLRCRLQTDTDFTRRLDFQSFRRALVTAVADEQVPTATQLAITGHTQLSTQMKHYLGKRTVRVPKGALPKSSLQSDSFSPPPATPSPTSTEHALAAALATQTAMLEALSAQVAALSAAPQPHFVGPARSKAALRVVKGGR